MTTQATSPAARTARSDPRSSWVKPTVISRTAAGMPPGMAVEPMNQDLRAADTVLLTTPTAGRWCG